MSGAASRHSRRTHVVLQLAAALIVLASVLADGSAAAAPKLPGSVWGVAVTSSPARDVAWKVSATLPKKGFNTVVVDRRVLSAPGYVAFRRQARKLHLTLVAGRQSGTACTSCLPLVGSATAGVKLSRTGATVLVRIGSPARIHQLRGLRKGRTIAIVELRGGAAFSASAWRRAIAVARKEPRLDLVVAPTGARAASALAAYTRLLGERTAVSTPEPPAPGTPPGGGGASDTLAPTIPGIILENRIDDDVDLRDVVGVDRQRRGLVLRLVPKRRERGDSDRYELHIHRPRVRYDLLAGR